MPKYTCLFAHYNRANKISEYVYTYLKQLSALDFHIVFISNSSIDNADRAILQTIPLLYRIEQRENTGYDFGAWDWAIGRGLVSDDTDYLLLTNDSIFGPYSDMGVIFQQMLSRPGIDFWALTDSYPEEWHLQTYFLCLSRKAFTSEAFRKI